MKNLAAVKGLLLLLSAQVNVLTITLLFYQIFKILSV